LKRPVSPSLEDRQALEHGLRIGTGGVGLTLKGGAIRKAQEKAIGRNQTGIA